MQRRWQRERNEDRESKKIRRSEQGAHSLQDQSSRKRENPEAEWRHRSSRREGQRGCGTEEWARSKGDSLEKALSRRPGLLGTGAAGTALQVAGTVSGSTTLKESQGTG